MLHKLDLAVIILSSNDVYVFTVDSVLVTNIGPNFFTKLIEFHAVMFQVGILLIVYCSWNCVESLNINNTLL